MKDKLILVTGASSGIGRASVDLLAQSGFTVLAGLRSQDDVEAFPSTDAIYPVKLDVTNTEDIDRVVTVVRGLGEKNNLFGVVNNAGINMPGALDALSGEDLSKAFLVNALAPLIISKKLLPFLAGCSGRIVNVGSTSGKVVRPLSGAYSASKAYLEAVSRTLRMEIKPLGVSVINIIPGAVKTPFWEKSIDFERELLGKLSDSQRQEYCARYGESSVSAVKPVLSPENVAEYVLRALAENKPRQQYIVGKDARFALLLEMLLPNSISDYLRQRRVS